MACPICNNKIGFANGTCIECGFNEISGDYRFIEVETDVLKAYLPRDVYFALIRAHEKKYMEVRKS